VLTKEPNGGLTSMSCRRVNRLLSTYIDDACSPRQRAQVEEHLNNCPECAALLRELRQTIELVSALPRDRTSDDFMAALRPRLRELEQTAEPGLLRRALQWMLDSQVRWRTATAAALVLVIAVGIFGMLSRRQDVRLLGDAPAVTARDAYLSNVVERHRRFAATNLPFDDRAFTYTSYYTGHDNGI